MFICGPRPKGVTALRVIIRILAISLLASVPFARTAGAQGASVFFGLGTAQNTSTGQLINTFGDGTLFPTPRMTGLFGKWGGDYMFRPYVGVGMEGSFRFSQGDYAGLKYRPSFYDFNVVLAPLPKSARIVPEFQAGLGWSKLNFYYNQQFCNSFSGCSSNNTLLTSSTHFQYHLSGGLRLYVTKNVFVRPEIDAHHVSNFFQFGRDWVTQYGASIGYSFGRE
jgi:hypothetical protein